jgi:hypothetical protein
MKKQLRSKGLYNHREREREKEREIPRYNCESMLRSLHQKLRLSIKIVVGNLKKITGLKITEITFYCIQVGYIVRIKMNVIHPKCTIFSPYLETNIYHFKMQYTKKFLVKERFFTKPSSVTVYNRSPARIIGLHTPPNTILSSYFVHL